jgi:hypothetical protein
MLAEVAVPFFRRDSSAEQRIRAFWDWWSGANARIAAAIDAGNASNLAEELSTRIHAVDDRLAWELAPGKKSRHALVATPEGDPVVRRTAIAWHEAAPAPDATWEYYPSRQPGALMVLSVGGDQVDLAEMRAVTTWDENDARVSVVLWHPAFPSLPDGVRQQAMFLFLDGLLGEDGVERWIGSIEPATGPLGGRTPEELRAEVERRSADTKPENWVLAERTDRSGNVAIVSARGALKRIDHPFADQHLRISVKLPAGQLPDNAEAARLNAEEDDLVARLGTGVIYAGRVTERGRRTLHFVVEAGGADVAERIARTWAGALSHRRVGVELRPDPRWEFQRELLG